MSIVIISQKQDIKDWEAAFKSLDSELEVGIYPNDSQREKVEMAIVWKHPHGVLSNYPNLKCIAAMGAGVDHILSDPDLPSNAIITRLIDSELSTDMTEFVRALVMNHLRKLSIYKYQEGIKDWHQHDYSSVKEVNIGIMGLGVLGRHVASQLRALGFNLFGWSQSDKNIVGVTTYSGDVGLAAFLNQSEILVCMLPLTTKTKNILNAQTFKKLPKNAFIINVARGEHLVDDDLVTMIDNGHLSGASLDVFRKEPLPVEHPFWAHPKINVTPHIASVTNPVSASKQIFENYLLLQQGLPLVNTIDRGKGY